MNRDFSRQSFLGAESDDVLARVHVAIIGLCGGGSHVAQQLAHVGVGGFVLCDPDIVEGSNLNRMVGATQGDAESGQQKVAVIARTILAINPHAEIIRCAGTWQSHALELRKATAVFGCVDSFVERAQLDGMCRRFLIPYIDIGMDVTTSSTGHVISGQVILSIPGRACMRCMGFITDELLAAEAHRYGAAGSRPQVVWPNGVLASTAVGLFLTLVLPWQGTGDVPLFIEYDGNSQCVFPSNRLPMVSHMVCKHFAGENDLGDPFYGKAVFDD